jgi:hypothetical protein
MAKEASTPAPNLIHEPPSLPNTPDHKRTRVIDPAPVASNIAGELPFHPQPHLTKILTRDSRTL